MGSCCIKNESQKRINPPVPSQTNPQPSDISKIKQFVVANNADSAPILNLESNSLYIKRRTFS